MKCRAFDAIVLGGGPAASSAAIGLCRQGARVVVIWKSKPALAHIAETIPPEAVLCFEELGLNAARLLRAQTPVFQERQLGQAAISIPVTIFSIHTAQHGG